ncbi:MAG: type IV toxin-antitoxin system AbiEi family antitoxin [Haliea sp.]
MARKAPPEAGRRVTTETNIAHRAMQVLQHLDVEAACEPGRADAARAADLLARIGHGRQQKTYHVEVKRGLRPATLAPLILRFQKTKPPMLLVTDYITPAMARLLREAGVAFVDLAGNAHIEQPGLRLFVIGNKPEHITAEHRTTRAFLPAGLRVLFILLCDPGRVNLPTRALAEKAGVANGTIGWVLKDLEKEGFLHVFGRRKRRLTRLRELLDRWVAAYPGQLRPQVFKGAYQARTQDWWKNVKYHQETVMLAGQPAADRLTKYLRPGEVTLYVRGGVKVVNELIARHALQKNPAGNIEILTAFWPEDLPTDAPGLVPTPLVYADLLATRDARCIETARMLYDRYLAERFRED